MAEGFLNSFKHKQKEPIDIYLRLSTDQSHERSPARGASHAFRQTKSQSMVDIRSYPQFSKEKVLQTPLKQPARDVRFQKVSEHLLLLLC